MSKPKGKHTASGQDPRELAKEWANRAALSGSSSGEFTLMLLNQICLAQWAGAEPDPSTVEVMQKAAQHALMGIAPRDVIEGLLAGQIMMTSQAAAECFRRAALVGQTFEGRQAALGQAGKLVRSFAALADSLNRHRGKGQQTVRVEHVHVHGGGRAIVGTVGQGGGDERQNLGQPHAPALAHEPEPALWRADAQREPVPIAGGER